MPNQNGYSFFYEFENSYKEKTLEGVNIERNLATNNIKIKAYRAPKKRKNFAMKAIDKALAEPKSDAEKTILGIDKRLTLALELMGRASQHAIAMKETLNKPDITAEMVPSKD